MYKNATSLAIVCIDESISKPEDLLFGGTPVVQHIILFIGNSLVRFVIIFVDDLDWD
jgi:hypothetical protein